MNLCIKYTRSIVAFIVIFTASTALFSQKAYIRLTAGYAFGINKTPLNSYMQSDAFFQMGGMPSNDNPMFNIYEDAQTNLVVERVRDSYGKGISVGVSGGYLFHKNIGLDLSVSYLLGREIRSSWDAPSSTITFNEKSSFSSLFLTPSLVIFSDFNILCPYARLGVSLGLIPKIKSESTYSNGVDSFAEKDELSKGTAVGFTSALGVTYPLTKQASLFIELTYNMLKYKPSERNIKTLTENGIEGPFADSQNLKDKVQIVVPVSFITPELLAYSYPLGSLGINVGIQFNFESPESDRGK